MSAARTALADFDPVITEGQTNFLPEWQRDGPIGKKWDGHFSPPE
jgi:hypothetical protein